MQRWTKIRRWFGVIALFGALSIAAIVFVSLSWLLGAGVGPLAGTGFGGSRPDASLSFSDWLEFERQRFANRTVQVTSDGFWIELPMAQLGIEVDIPAMLQLAQRQRRHGSVAARMQRVLSARLGRLDYAWLTRFDREVARATFQSLAASIDRSPVDAEVDLVRRHRVRARSGAKLDVDATLDYIESHRSIDLEHVALSVTSLPPRVRDEDASAVDVLQVLSRFETDFRTKAGSRAVNIRVAARALQGQVIGPGESFSFNQVVGRRLESRGYLEAPVIVDDEIEPGVGGGVCQVATTLHAAAVLGGLEVIERRSHSRPSGYAPLGLDATVIDGSVDLKLRNPYSVPISVATSFPERFRIRVELLGLSLSERIEHQFAVGKRHDFYRRVVTRPELANGSYQRKQKGSFGFDVQSVVTSTRDGVVQRRRRYRSRYWPVPEVYWVGPDTELSILPELPDGVSGVQRDGTTVLGTIPPAVEERSANADVPGDSGEH